jgi:DNA gyrase subunit A
MSLAADESTVLTVTENGYGKRTKVGEYRLQHRGGQGIINIKTSERNGLVVGMLTVDDDDEIVLVSTDGIVMRCEVKGIRTIGRNTQGVTVMKPNAGAKVSAVAKAVADTKEERITDVPAGEEAPDDGVEETDSEDFESGEEEE